MRLTELLLQISYDLHYSPKDWAEKLNVPSDEVSDYFTGKKELPFFPFLSLLRDNYEDYEKQRFFVSAFIDAIHTAPNILYSMELVSQMQEIGLLEKLIDKGLKSEDPIVQEWADMYALSLKRDNLVEDDFLYATKKATLKTEEMKIFLETMRPYMLLKINANLSVDKMLDEVYPQLDNIQDEYLRNSFRIRLHSSTIYSTLRLNLVGKVRRIGEQFLQDEVAKKCFPFKYTYILHRYAMSFMYEDPDKTLSQLDDSIELLRKIPNKAAQYTINEHEKSKAFVKNIWGIDQPEPDDIPEKIHYFIARNEMEKAQALLIDLKKQQPLTAFQDYYWGHAFSDEKALQRSYERFRSNGDFFFAVLPVRALSKISLEKLKEKNRISKK